MFIGILLLFPLLLFLHAIWRNLYWHQRGISGPKPWPFLGNLYALFYSSPAGILQLAKWTRQYGPVYGIQQGCYHVLVVTDPKVVAQALVKRYTNFQSHLISPIAGDKLSTKTMTVFDVFGPRWKRVRSCLSPFLAPASFQAWAPIMWDSVQKNVELLVEGSAHGQPVNLYKYFGELTTDISLRMGLGTTESLQFQNEFSKLSRNAQKRFNRNAFELVAWPSYWFGSSIVRFVFLYTGLLRQEPVLVLYSKLNALVVARKEELIKKRDDKATQNNILLPLIDQLLNYECPESDSNSLLRADAEATKQGKTQYYTERKLIHEEIVMNLLVFVLATFGVANSMAITFFMLAMYPEVQRKLKAEIERIFTNDEMPSFQQLDKMEYAHAIQLETLRLFPVASAATPRMCNEDVQLSDTIFVEKGTAIWPDVWTIHRNPEIWGPDAGEFRPERWLEENTGIEGKKAFYGFGDGPRGCPGKRLATLFEKMAMVRLLRSHTLQCAEPNQDVGELTGHAVLASETLFVRLEASKIMSDVC